NDYISSTDRIVSLAESDLTLALEELSAFRAAYARLADEMETLTGLIENEAAAVETRAHLTAVRSDLFMGSGLAIGVLLMASMAWVISRSIITPLNRLVTGAENAATGDLGQPLHIMGNDEIAHAAQALESMRANLASMV